MTPCPAQAAPQDGKSSSTGSTLPETAAPISSPSASSLILSLTHLTAALLEQTQALNRLAASNEALVLAVLEPEPDPDGDTPSSYMDGTAVRERDQTQAL